MSEISEHPFFQKYRPYQIGFIQDRHNALTGELDLLIRFFDIKILTKKSFKMKIDKLLDNKIISKSLYDDLNLINCSRNKFVKSNSNNDREIRNLLNNIKSLSWSILKRNKYGVYRLFLVCIGVVHLELTNSPNYKKYLKALGIF